MSPSPDAGFEKLDESLKDVDLSSEVSEEGLEVLKNELQERIDHQEEQYYYYLDMGFRTARTLIVLLGIFASVMAVLINQELVSLSDLSSSFFIFGAIIGAISILSGTILPFFVTYISNREQMMADQESVMLAQDTGLVYSKQQILSFVIEQKIDMTKRRHKSVRYTQVLALLSQYLFIAFAIVVGYGILAAV